jgi:hypothetical protein
MPVTDVFRTACWNFVGGDRAIEGILRDLPGGAALVVRNRLAHVLPTAAALADLAVLRGRGYRVRVPANAWYAPELNLVAPVEPAALPALLLERLWGIGMAQEPGGDTILLATGFLDDGGASAAAGRRLAVWLAGHPDLPTAFVAPPGRRLAAALWPHAGGAWSVQTALGRNAFARPGVEEAVFERRAARILVAAPDPVTAMYTAVGAADGLVARGVAPRDAGARVAVLAGLWDEPAGLPQPLSTLLDAHLREALGVADTAADPRVRPTGEGIAIDLAG